MGKKKRDANKASKKKRPRKSLSREDSKKILSRIKFKETNNCIYYKKTFCDYCKDECYPDSPHCHFISKNALNLEKTYSGEPLSTKAIVLSNNRKCINKKHYLVEVTALVRVLNHINIIKDIKVPAAYCTTCKQYIVLKSDYKAAKENGILLCEVINKETLSSSNNSNIFGAFESRIHALGYNVNSSKPYGYSSKKRQIILANIMENYHIPKQEILSLIDINIIRHTKQPNYSKAIEKWKEDRQFVANYKLGDLPEVIIKKMIIGKR